MLKKYLNLDKLGVSHRNIDEILDRASEYLTTANGVLTPLAPKSSLPDKISALNESVERAKAMRKDESIRKEADDHYKKLVAILENVVSPGQYEAANGLADARQLLPQLTRTIDALTGNVNEDDIQAEQSTGIGGIIGSGRGMETLIDFKEGLTNAIANGQLQSYLETVMKGIGADASTMAQTGIKEGGKLALATSTHVLDGSYGLSCIDMLDQIAIRMKPHHPQFRTVLRMLSKLCADVGRLPSSFFIASERLVKQGSYPEIYSGFADVWRGKLDAQDVALKELHVSERDNIQAIRRAFFREVIHWKFLEHPNLLPFLGINESLFKFCIVSPWAKNGNISSYLKENAHIDRLKLLREAAIGLEYLHSLGIVHGDLKCANILINDTGDACLADFGLSTLIQNLDSATAFLTTTSGGPKGTIRWMAPEIMDPEAAGYKDSRPTKESDVYSFVMVMLEVFTGNIPFAEHRNDAVVMRKVIVGVRPPRPPEATPLGLSDEVWELMGRGWDADPRKRTGISDVVTALAP